MANEQVFESGAPRVLVAGANGFAGALAARLLWEHPGFELVAITSRTRADETLQDVYPWHRVPLRLEELDLERHADVEAAIIAYPHAASAPVVAAFRERGVRVVDLSADFRLRDVTAYEQWYGSHPHAELLDDAVYGLTELYRDEIAGADLIANPGCFPTAALIALAPLARAGVISDVIIDAKTGVSGAGHTPTDLTHFPFASENVTPYKVGAHRHRPEIEQQLTRLGANLAVQFQPYLVAMVQGKLTSCYVTPTSDISTDDLTSLYHEAYGGEPFIELTEKPPTPLEVKNTNFCRIFAMVDAHTRKLMVISSIDNLWKGSASQAVQNLNLMFEKDEGAGISGGPSVSGALL